MIKEDFEKIRTYTVYLVKFQEPQWLRCFKGPSRSFDEAHLVFFKATYGAICYRRPDTSSGYPVYPGMIENISFLQQLCPEG